MKKSNVILQTAIAGALLAMTGAGYAATSITATSVAYATEQFLGTAPTTAIVAPTIDVIATAGIGAGSHVTVMVELSAGNYFTVVPTGVIISGASTAANAITLWNGNTVPTVAVNSTLAGTQILNTGAGTTDAWTNNTNAITITGVSTSAVAAGGVLARITTPSISAKGLSTTAGTVTATASIVSGVAATFTLGTAIPTTGLLEAASPAKTIATSAEGVTLTAAANTSTSRIDLGATPTSAKFTLTTASATETASTSVYKLGTYTATNGSAKNVAAGNAAYTVSDVGTGAGATVLTLTAPVGFFAPLGTTGTISVKAANATACGGAAIGTSTVLATGSAATVTSVNTTTTVPTSGTAYDICMAVNGSTAIVAGTPSLTAVMGTASAAQNSTKTLASTPMQALAVLGTTYDVRNYVPAAATGYTTFVRVINTGTTAAAVSVALIDEVTGVAGTPAVLTTAANGFAAGTMAAGAARNFTSTEIEAALGAPVAVGARPRLRITAPTSGLNVQTFLAEPTAIVDMTGAQ